MKTDDQGNWQPENPTNKNPTEQGLQTIAEAIIDTMRPENDYKVYSCEAAENYLVIVADDTNKKLLGKTVLDKKLLKNSAKHYGILISNVINMVNENENPQPQREIRAEDIWDD